MPKVTVLVADDEPAIRKLVDRGLTSYGYNVIVTSNGQEALDIAARKAPNIILLDISLETRPDGLEVCQQIREWSKTPIIMLTVRDEKKMKLAALNAGADDYVTKPFDMDELEARIRAVLRRSAYEGAKSSSGEIQVGDLRIDFVNRRVWLKGDEVHLTRKEYGLLKVLASNPGRVITFQRLLEELWGKIGRAKPEHNVRVFINTLRKKLKDDPGTTIRPRFIFNESGVGYRFADLGSSAPMTAVEEE
jgi:two-component system KDP operon response regulator KdpE